MHTAQKLNEEYWGETMKSSSERNAIGDAIITNRVSIIGLLWQFYFEFFIFLIFNS